MPYRENIAYHPYHVAANATKAAAGVLFDGTSNSTIAGAGSASFTLHTRVDGDPGWIQVGSRLVIDVGGGVAEIVTVTGKSGPSGALDTATNPFTITATFAFAHSPGFAVRYTKGTRLGTVLFNALGTSETLTLFNGHPDIAGSSTIAVITPANAPFKYSGDVDGGLWYTYSGSGAGDFTIMAAPIPPLRRHPPMGIMSTKSFDSNPTSNNGNGDDVSLDATGDTGPNSGAITNTDMQQARSGFGPNPTMQPIVAPKWTIQQMDPAEAASQFGPGSAAKSARKSPTKPTK